MKDNFFQSKYKILNFLSLLDILFNKPIRNVVSIFISSFININSINIIFISVLSWNLWLK